MPQKKGLIPGEAWTSLRWAKFVKRCIFVVRTDRLSILGEMKLNSCQCWERCFKDDSEQVFSSWSQLWNVWDGAGCVWLEDDLLMVCRPVSYRSVRASCALIAGFYSIFNMFNTHSWLSGASRVEQRGFYPKSEIFKVPGTVRGSSSSASKWCQPRSQVKRLPFSPRK